MGRFDRLRIDVGDRATSSPEVRRAIKWELVLVFVDLLTIVLVQTLFYSIVVPMVLGPGDNDLTRQALTISISVLLMLPAIINMYQGIKRIAGLLASGEAGGAHAKKRMRLYITYRNLGDVAAILLVVMLFLPFLAQTVGVPGSIWVGLGVLAVVLIGMSVRSIRRARHPEAGAEAEFLNEAGED